MQVYAIKIKNFLRFGEKNNSIVFDLNEEQKKNLKQGETTFDSIYEELRKDPVKYIKEIKERGIEKYVGILGRIDGSFDNSNGAGKSSVMEAICYAHYDKIMRKLINTDKVEKAGLDVVTRICKKYPDNLIESYVEEFFEEDNKIYRIKRGRTFSKNQKSNTPILEFECYTDGKIESESGHRKSDTNQNIENINLMDYDLFVSTQMFGQNDAGKFLIGTDKIKKEMIISLLNLEKIVDGCLEETRLRKNNQDKKVQSIKYNLETLEKNIIKSFSKWLKEEKTVSDINDDNLNKVNVNIENFINSIQDKINENNKKIEEIDRNIIELEKSKEIITLNSYLQEEKQLVNNLNEQKIEIEKQTKEWDDLIKDNTININNKNQKLKEINSKVIGVRKVKDEVSNLINNFNMEKCKDYLIKVEKAKIVKPKYEKELKDNTEKREAYIKTIASFSGIINSKKQEIKDIKIQLDNNSGDSFVCKYCKNIVTRNNIKKTVDDIQLVIDESKKEIGKYQEYVRPIEEKINDINSKLSKINEYIINEQKIISKIKEFEDYKLKLKEIENLILELNDQEKSIDEEINKSNNNINEYKNKKNEIFSKFKEKIEELQKSLKEIQQKIEESKKSSSETNNKIKELNNNKNNISCKNSDYSKEIGSVNNEKSIITEQMKEIVDVRNSVCTESKILQRLMIIDTVYGLDGIQTKIVKKYLPLLNLYIKEYTDIATDGNLNLNFDINSRSDIFMDIVGNSADSYFMLSGGEKMLVRLITDIGLSRLKFSRIAKKPEMICLDEIFGPLDNKNTESVFKILNKLGEIFNRVIIISHKSEIQKIIENNIVVEKDIGMNGLSEIKYLGKFERE